MKMRYVLVISLLIIIIFLIGIVFSKKNITIKNITYFYYHYTKGYAINSNISYTIECTDKCMASIKLYGKSEEEAIMVEVSKDKMEELVNIINMYRVYKWDGFDKVDKNVLDGDSFGLSIKSENKNISCSGYMKYPKNYRDFEREVDKFFNELIK